MEGQVDRINNHVAICAERKDGPKTNSVPTSVNDNASKGWGPY